MNRTLAVTFLTLAVAGLAAPAPSSEPHRFAPIDPKWRVETHLLRPDKDSDLYHTVKPADRDPAFKGYLTQRTYFAEGESEPRKVLWSRPSGRPMLEVDYVGAECHQRRWHPDGKLSGYSFSRDGKSLVGESISPDGKGRHRLTGGDGELVDYGEKATVHRWFVKGRVLLAKTYRGGRLVEITLVAKDYPAYLRVTAEQERLREEKGVWKKAAGADARWDAFLDPDHFPARWDARPAPPRPYDKSRADLVKGLDAAIKGGGWTWERLGVAFIRDGKPWPAER